MRFGLGFLFLLPIALARRRQWPPRRDWIAVLVLGLLFFAVFFILFNVSLRHTTAARGALALSTLPLLTMVVAAALGVERLTRRKTAGVLMRRAGSPSRSPPALATRRRAPGGATWSWSPGRSAWRSTACDPVPTSPGRGRSRSRRPAWAWARRPSRSWRGWAAASSAVARFGPAEWTAIGYLGLFGAALVFYLWAFALERTTPTRVASTIAVNPLTASIVAALLLGERIGLNLLVGVAAVFAGIWIASSKPRPAG